jgi:hypothetical protein
MLEIADQNMKKVAHLNNKTTSAASLKEYYSDKLKLIDQMIEVLGSTV